MKRADVEERLKAALQQLCVKDRHLLYVGASERSIAFRLGLYLQCKFSDWHVDCEYNRHGPNRKRVALDESRCASKDLVIPDIIIHRRGQQGPNLLAIEVKKDIDGQGGKVQHDLEKLKAYKRELCYAYAVFLKVWTGENAQDPLICWVGER
jgi:hypothetical protein